MEKTIRKISPFDPNSKRTGFTIIFFGAWYAVRGGMDFCVARRVFGVRMCFLFTGDQSQSLH